ncbi:MAG: zinc-binding dehydrogenase, partial [Acidimicrobiia bacterium]
MRALVLSEGGRLSVEDRPVPEAVADQVLVRVHSAGLNRADLLQRAGRYPPPPGAPPDIPGLEFAGVVEAAGPAALGLQAGDAVMGIVAGGAQAEYLVTPESQCARVPDRLDLMVAGGVPEAFITAHDAMCTQADLHPGARVLIHAVASGVGTAALQLACAIGATVTGTSRTKDKLDRAVDLGLHHAVVAERDFDPADLARRITNAGGPADVVVDLVGGPYLAVDIAAAAPRARIVIVGIIAGGRAELDMATLMGRRLTVRGTVLRSRPAHEKAAATHA